jgi:glutathione S-transferase
MHAAGWGLSVALSAEGRTDVQRIETIWRECRDLYGRHGPWLFGAFSIADAMYAPVALRFNSYGAQLEACSRDYVATVLTDRHVSAWVAQARVNE